MSLCAEDACCVIVRPHVSPHTPAPPTRPLALHTHTNAKTLTDNISCACRRSFADIERLHPSTPAHFVACYLAVHKLFIATIAATTSANNSHSNGNGNSSSCNEANNDNDNGHINSSTKYSAIHWLYCNNVKVGDAFVVAIAGNIVVLPLFLLLLLLLLLFAFVVYECFSALLAQRLPTWTRGFSGWLWFQVRNKNGELLSAFDRHVVSNRRCRL